MIAQHWQATNGIHELAFQNPDFNLVDVCRREMHGLLCYAAPNHWAYHIGHEQNTSKMPRPRDRRWLGSS